MYKLIVPWGQKGIPAPTLNLGVIPSTALSSRLYGLDLLLAGSLRCLRSPNTKVESEAAASRALPPYARSKWQALPRKERAGP